MVEACDAPRARLVRGDALDLVAALRREGTAGKVDLVYIDPPFFSDADYVHEARLDGRADGRISRTHAYGDRWARKEGGLESYLDMLAPRLEALASVLAPRGTLWVHLDWRASYLVRVLLDEIFGKDGFLNEIVWRRAPNLGRQAASGQFGRTLDTLVVYGGKGATLTPPTRPELVPRSAVRIDDEGRPFTTAPRGDYTDASVERLAAEGRILRTATGKVYVKYFLTPGPDGEHYRERRVDALWTDVPPLRHASPSERTGYPTQKPLALLDRVVRAGSPEGGLVVDAFSGSGTTAEAAVRAGRRAVVSDPSPVAIATARARLARAGITTELSEATGSPEVPSLSVEASAERRGASVVVTLDSPTDPLSWAIDATGDAGGAFRASWSSVRSLGKRPEKVARTATLDGAPKRLVVRVYADDGAVGQCEVLCP